MKLIKTFLITAVATMPVFLCSCPGGSLTNNEPEAPLGYIVKMGKDYSENVFVYMSASEIDTFYVAEKFFSDSKHINKLTNDYYQFYGALYDRIACTSIKLGEWNDSTKTKYEPISDYVIDADPFTSVYAYYVDYTTLDLIKIIESGNLNTLEKIK